MIRCDLKGCLVCTLIIIVGIYILVGAKPFFVIAEVILNVGKIGQAKGPWHVE